MISVKFVAIIVGLFVVLTAVVTLVVWPKIKSARQTLDIQQKVATAKDEGHGLWAIIRLKFLGIRTIVTGYLGALALIVPDILSRLNLIDWSKTSLAEWGPTIGTVVIILMLVFHGDGVKTAAETQPNS